MCYIIKTKTKEDVKDDPYLFCPITNKACNEHCMWLVRFDTLTEEGANTFYECIVNSIFNMLCDVSGCHEQEDEL